VKENRKDGHEGAYHYTQCGLDYVYLSGGVEFVDGPRGKQVIIRDIEGLHQAIGRFLVNERHTLSGKELRFLRQEMLMSQALLANLLEVSEQTVHRWETAKSDTPKPAEALIRLLYNEQFGNNNEKIKTALKRIAALEDEIDKKRLTLTDRDGEWEPDDRKAA
jgi:putative transcriptional regulator